MKQQMTLYEYVGRFLVFAGFTRLDTPIYKCVFCGETFLNFGKIVGARMHIIRKHPLTSLIELNTKVGRKPKKARALV